MRMPRIRINEMIRKGHLKAGEILKIRATDSHPEQTARLMENGNVQLTVNAWATGVRHGAVNIYEYVYASDGRLLNEIREDMPAVTDEMPEEDKEKLEELLKKYGEDAILDILSKKSDD